MTPLPPQVASASLYRTPALKKLWDGTKPDGTKLKWSSFTADRTKPGSVLRPLYDELEAALRCGPAWPVRQPRLPWVVGAHLVKHL